MFGDRRQSHILAATSALLLVVTSCTPRTSPPTLLSDATILDSTTDAAKAAAPTMICITEADRFHFAQSGTFNFRLVSSTVGPFRDASLCIQNPPVPDHECAQVVSTPFPDVWTKTVTHDNTIVMFGSENNEGGAGLLYTDCAADNRPRSYVTWHNQSRTAQFTFLVELVEAAP